MRLLMVGESGMTHVRRWAQYFRDEGVEVLVVSPSNDPVDGVRVIQFPASGTWWGGLPRGRFGGWLVWIAGWPYWRRVLSEFRPDVVHIHYIHAQARDYFYYRGVRRLVVSSYGSDVVFENGESPSGPTVRRIRHVLRKADAITATTQFLAAATRKLLPPREMQKPIHVIPFGVDCDVFRPVARRPPDPSRPVVIGFVKHLEPKYGPDILLEAFNIIQKRHPGTRLVMAGHRQSMAAQLRQQVAAWGLAEKVEFVGHVPHDEVPRLMGEFDIFVMPSVFQSEVFGVAAVEASACGVPVVATAVGGVPEAVQHNETGLLVPPRDAEAVARACIELIEQPEKRKALGSAGRAFVLARYQWRTTAGQMKALYESLLRS